MAPLVLWPAVPKGRPKDISCEGLALLDFTHPLITPVPSHVKSVTRRRKRKGAVSYRGRAGGGWRPPALLLKQGWYLAVGPPKAPERT